MIHILFNIEENSLWDSDKNATIKTQPKINQNHNSSTTTSFESLILSISHSLFLSLSLTHTVYAFDFPYFLFSSHTLFLPVKDNEVNKQYIQWYVK